MAAGSDPRSCRTHCEVQIRCIVSNVWNHPRRIIGKEEVQGGWKGCGCERRKSVLVVKRKEMDRKGSKGTRTWVEGRSLDQIFTFAE